MKKYFSAVDTYKAEPTPDNMELAQKAMSLAYSKIDKAVKSNVLHKNNGARKKARLAKTLKTLEAVAS